MLGLGIPRPSCHRTYPKERPSEVRYLETVLAVWFQGCLYGDLSQRLSGLGPGFKDPTQAGVRGWRLSERAALVFAFLVLVLKFKEQGNPPGHTRSICSCSPVLTELWSPGLRS